MSHGFLSTVLSYLRSLLHQTVASGAFLESLLGYVWETELLNFRLQMEFYPGQLADSIWKNTKSVRKQKTLKI